MMAKMLRILTAKFFHPLCMLYQLKDCPESRLPDSINFDNLMDKPTWFVFFCWIPSLLNVVGLENTEFSVTENRRWNFVHCRKIKLYLWILPHFTSLNSSGSCLWECTLCVSTLLEQETWKVWFYGISGSPSPSPL